MKKPVLYLLLAAVLFTSCATASLSKYRGVGRIKQYDFYSYDVPSAFDGFRIGFASDFVLVFITIEQPKLIRNIRV